MLANSILGEILSTSTDTCRGSASLCIRYVYNKAGVEAAHSLTKMGETLGFDVHVNGRLYVGFNDVSFFEVQTGDLPMTVVENMRKILREPHGNEPTPYLSHYEIGSYRV